MGRAALDGRGAPMGTIQARARLAPWRHGRGQHVKSGLGARRSSGLVARAPAMIERFWRGESARADGRSLDLAPGRKT